MIVNETVRHFLQEPPPRRRVAGILQAVLLKKRSAAVQVRIIRFAAVAVTLAALSIAQLPKAWEDFRLDHGTTVETSARITGIGQLDWQEDHASREAVLFDYTSPDGELRQGRSVAPARKFRFGQTVPAEVLPESPELVRLRGAGRSAEGSSMLLLIPFFVLFLLLCWWGAVPVVLWDERQLLRHATWVEATVNYEPAGKSTAEESKDYGLYNQGVEVELRYELKGEVTTEVWHVSTAEAEKLQAQQQVSLLVLPKGKELGKRGRTRLVRADRYFPA